MISAPAVFFSFELSLNSYQAVLKAFLLKIFKVGIKAHAFNVRHYYYCLGKFDASGYPRLVFLERLGSRNNLGYFDRIFS
jgi:hypothetical protein